MTVPAITRVILALFSLAVIGVPTATHAQLLAPAVRHRAVADLRISGDVDDPRAALSSVEDAVLLSDGSLVLAQPQEHLLRQFDSRGRFVRQIGMKGKGPGEFERIMEMGRLADTIYVVDTRNLRVQLFSPLGAPLTALRLPLLRPPGGQRPYLTALLANGQALSSTREGEGGDQATLTIWLHRRDGTAAVPVARLRHDDVMTTVRVGSARLGFRQPYASPSFFLNSPPSGTLALVEQSPAAGRRGTGTLRLTWHGRGQPEAQTFDYRMPELRAAEADSLVRGFAEEMAEALSSNPGPRLTPAAIAREIDRILYRPPHHPLVQVVHMDDDGRVWLRSRDSDDWYVITRGSPRPMVVALPRKARFLLARGPVVWTLDHDEYDVPVLVRYRIAPR